MKIALTADHQTGPSADQNQIQAPWDRGMCVCVCVLVGACMASTCRHLLSFQPDGLVPADHRRVADVICSHGALT